MIVRLQNFGAGRVLQPFLEVRPVNEVFRQEKKYLMTIADGQALGGRLGAVMREDGHNGAFGYRVRSLYFDTLDETDFYDKLNGLELRRKLRLRCYGPEADFALLEMKQKEGIYQKKRSLQVSRRDAERLALGEYDALLTYDEPFAAECYGLMQRMCYRPKTVVEYRRRAFVAKENHIRITLDHNIVATEASSALFAPDLPLYPVLDPFQLVLEVKYDGFLLSYIKGLVNAADRSELSVSKYCLARSAGLGFSW